MTLYFVEYNVIAGHAHSIRSSRALQDQVVVALSGLNDESLCVDVVVEGGRDIPDYTPVPPNAESAGGEWSSISGCVAYFYGEFAVGQVEGLVVHFIHVGVHLDNLCGAAPGRIVDRASALLDFS